MAVDISRFKSGLTESQFSQEYLRESNRIGLTFKQSEYDNAWNTYNRKTPQKLTDDGPKGSTMDNTGQFIGNAIDAASIKNNQMKAGEDIGIKGLYDVAIDKSTGKLNTFSQMVEEAMALGYTEPDPRIDLNGIDLRRKLIILAREAGAKIESDEVIITSVLSENCFPLKT